MEFFTPSWELCRWIFVWFYRSVWDFSEQCSRDKSVGETVLACNLRTVVQYMFYSNHSYQLFSVGFSLYEGWNFNSGNYLFTTDTK